MHGKEVCKGMEWIHVAKNRDMWWVLVNTLMEFQVS